MSHFYNISVDCVRGNDEILEVSDGVSYKSLDKALSILKNGSRIFLHPGYYPGSNLEVTDNPFIYELEGTGMDVELGEIIHEGYVDGTFKSMKIRDVKLQCSNSCIEFQNISFVGSHKMTCKGFLGTCENPLNEIEFKDCTFGNGYQIYISSGMYCFTFKNCKFRSKKIPIIYVHNGDAEIKATLCNFEVPIVFNRKGVVYIYHTACNFNTEICIGDKECSVFSKDGEVSLSGMKSYIIPKEEQIKHLSKPESCDLSKAIEIDTDKYPEVKLRYNTEFVYCHGSGILQIELPDTADVENGHRIEISNDTPFVIIEDIKYFDRTIIIRYLISCGWHFYKTV